MYPVWYEYYSARHCQITRIYLVLSGKGKPSVHHLTGLDAS